LREYIKESASRVIEDNYRLHNHKVYIINPFTNDIGLSSVLKTIEGLIPAYLVKNFEGIYVGKFNDFNNKNRPFNAVFKDGSIYVSSEQDDNEDLIDDIIHEISHSIEVNEEFNDIIYGDGALESEFLAKRQSLFHLLDKPTVSMGYYLSPEYNKTFDEHLYNDLGYDYLRNVSSGLFYSPYSITSLKEYWAKGFESYLLGDPYRLRDLSPVLFKKVHKILNIDKEEY